MKSGGVGQSIDLGDRFLQGADDILVRLFIETDMAVADLNEAEIARGDRSYRAEYFGSEHSAAHRPKHPGAGPGHAFEEAAPIDAIRIVIL